MNREKLRLCEGNRTATIIRVSNESRVEGHSLEAQRPGIEQWCLQRGYVLLKEYREAGVSAQTDEIEKRPELLQLLEDAERGEFDIVVARTLDQLARKLSIQMQALARLVRAGVGFAGVNDPFDYSTPQGRLMLNQMGPTTSSSPIFSESTSAKLLELWLSLDIRSARFHLGINDKKRGNPLSMGQKGWSRELWRADAKTKSV